LIVFPRFVLPTISSFSLFAPLLLSPDSLRFKLGVSCFVENHFDVPFFFCPGFYISFVFARFALRLGRKGRFRLMSLAFSWPPQESTLSFPKFLLFSLHTISLEEMVDQVPAFPFLNLGTKSPFFYCSFMGCGCLTPLQCL